MEDDEMRKLGRSRPSGITAVIMLAAAAAGTGALLVLMSSRAGGAPAAKPHTEITFCHRTGSNSNPYRVITTDPDSIIKAGHGDHTGPIWDPSLKARHIRWGDIVPPFTASGRFFPGLNWPAGAAILANHCVVPISASSPSQTSPAPGPSTESSSTSVRGGSASTPRTRALRSSVGPIPSAAAAGLHTPLAGAGLEAWGIVLLLAGGGTGLAVGLTPLRRRGH